MAQRQWLAGALLVRTTRGWLARRRVQALRETLAVAATLRHLTRVVAWRTTRAQLQHVRVPLLAQETARFERETACAASAAEDAAALVRAELAKVVRNATHARLQHLLTQLRASGESASAAEGVGVAGSGAVREATRRNGDGHLRQLIDSATAMLIAQAQHDARARAAGRLPRVPRSC